MRDDQQREVIEQLEKALNVGETKTGEASYNTSTHIPVVLWDFHMAVDKLLDLQEGMTDPASDFGSLSDRDKADGYIAAKVVESVLSKTDSQLKEDYASMADIVGPGKLGIGEICGAALEYYSGRDHDPSENLYLSDRTPERLDMFYDNFGDTGNDNVGCPDYAHCWLSDENDHRDMDNLEIGSDRHGVEHGGVSGVSVRSIGPDAESFLTSVSQADKIKNLEEYRNGSGELNITKEENVRVNEWIAAAYKSAADEIMAKEDATGDELYQAGLWYLEAEAIGVDWGISEFDGVGDYAWYAFTDAADSYAKEGRFADAYEASRGLSDTFMSDATKLSYLDQAIYLTAREYLQDHVQNNGELIDAIENKGEGYTDVVRESLGKLEDGYKLDESVSAQLVRLLDVRDAFVKESIEKSVRVESAVDRPETKEIEKDPAKDETDTETPDTDAPTEAAPAVEATAEPEKPNDVETNTFSPADITAEIVEKAAGAFIDLLKDASTESRIRDTLGDKAADRYKDLLVDLSSACAVNDKDRIESCCSELLDILEEFQKSDVDKGVTADAPAPDPATKDSTISHRPTIVPGSKDGAALDEFFRLGKLANVDLNTNRRITLHSNNPYQLMANLDFMKYIRAMDKDTFQRITDQEKPSAIRTEAAIVITTINCLKAFTLSNFASVYSEALYQAFLKEAKNDQEKKETDLIDKAGVSYILKYYTKDVSNLVSRPDSDLSKQLQQELGREKYENFKDLLDKYNETGEKSYLREASRLIDRADNVVGGRGMNERYDRRDFVQNVNIFRDAVEAWRDGREIDLTITGKGTERGRVTTGYLILSFINLISNSDIGYTLEKKIIEGFQDLFFSVFDAKHESVGDMIGRMSGAVEKRPDGWVDMGQRPYKITVVTGGVSKEVEVGKYTVDRYRNNEDGTADTEQKIEYNDGKTAFINTHIDPKSKMSFETRITKYPDGRETKMENTYNVDSDGKRGDPISKHGTQIDDDGIEHTVDKENTRGFMEGTDSYTDKENVKHEFNTSIEKEVHKTTYPDGTETKLETTYKLDSYGDRLRDSKGKDIRDTEKGTYIDKAKNIHYVDRTYRDGRMEGTDRYVDSKGVEHITDRTEARDIKTDKYPDGTETRMETTYKLDADGNRMKGPDGKQDIRDAEKGTYRDGKGIEHNIERTEGREVDKQKHPGGIETRMETTYKLDADGNRMKDADGKDIKDTEKGTYLDKDGIVHDVDRVYRDGHMEGTDRFVDKKGIEHNIERTEGREVDKQKHPGGIETQMETTYKLDADGNRMKDADGKDIKVTEKGSYVDNNGIVHDVDRVYRDGHMEGTDHFVDKKGIEHNIERTEGREVDKQKHPGGIETRMETTYKLDADGNRMRDADGKYIKETEKGTYIDNNGVVHDIDRTYRDGHMEGTDHYVDKKGVDYTYDRAEARDIRTTKYPDGTETRMETTYKLDADGNRMKDDDGKDIKDTEKGTYLDKDCIVHDVDRTYRDGHMEGTDHYVDKKGVDHTFDRAEARDIRTTKYPDGTETRMETTYKLDADGNRMKDDDGKDIKDTEKGTYLDKDGIVHNVDRTYRDGHMEGTDHYVDKKGVEYTFDHAEVRDIRTTKYPNGTETRMEITYKLDADGNRMKDIDGKDIKDTEKGTYLDKDGIIHDIDRTYRDGHMEGTDHFVDKRGVEHNIERTEGHEIDKQNHPGGVETWIESTYKLDADGNRMRDSDGRYIKETEKGTYVDNNGIIHDVDRTFRDGHMEGTDHYIDKKGIAYNIDHSEARDIRDTKYPDGTETRMETTYKLDADGNRIKDDTGRDVKDAEKGSFIDKSGIVHTIDKKEHNGYMEGTDSYVDKGNVKRDITTSIEKDVYKSTYPDGRETQMETTYKLNEDGAREKDPVTGKDAIAAEKGSFIDKTGIEHNIDYKNVDGRMEGTDHYVDKKGIEHDIDRSEAREIDRQKYPDGTETRMETTYKLDTDGNRMKDEAGRDVKDTEKGTYRDNGGTVHDVDRAYNEGHVSGTDHFVDKKGIDHNIERTESREVDHRTYPDGRETQMETTYKLDENGNRMRDADNHYVKDTEKGSYIDDRGVEHQINRQYDDSGKYVDLPIGNDELPDPFDAQSMAELESIDSDIDGESTKETYHTVAIDNATELDAMAPEELPEDAPVTYMNAANDLATKENPTGDELRQAAIWVEKAMPDNPGESRALHAMACETYLKEDNAYGAYKEALAAKEKISPEMKEMAISAYATDAVERAKSDTGTYITAARLFDMLPPEKQNTPEALLSYEKAADAVERNQNASRADLLKGVEWGSRIEGYDKMKIELMEVRAKDMTNNYETFTKDMVQPAIQHAIMEGKSVDLKGLYEKVSAAVEPYYPAKASVQENGEVKKYTKTMFINDVRMCIDDMREANGKEDPSIENISDNIDRLEQDVDAYEAERIDVSEKDVEAVETDDVSQENDSRNDTEQEEESSSDTEKKEGA